MSSIRQIVLGSALGLGPTAAVDRRLAVQAATYISMALICSGDAAGCSAGALVLSSTAAAVSSADD